jgi:hypothetical protein
MGLFGSDLGKPRNEFEDRFELIFLDIGFNLDGHKYYDAVTLRFEREKHANVGFWFLTGIRINPHQWSDNKDHTVSLAQQALIRALNPASEASAHFTNIFKVFDKQNLTRKVYPFVSKHFNNLVTSGSFNQALIEKTRDFYLPRLPKNYGSVFAADSRKSA